MRFDLINTTIEGLKVIQRKPICDDRGFLSRIYCQDDFKLMGVDKRIGQINQTLTKKKGAARGLHFQLPPYAETKIVSCIRGEIFDVAIDLRKGSPTFLKWHAEILSEVNKKSFLIPEGFAHGFQTLTDDCELLYLHTAPYSKEHERGLNLVDDKLGVAWPLTITDLSDRDRSHEMIKDNFEGMDL